MKNRLIVCILSFVFFGTIVMLTSSCNSCSPPPICELDAPTNLAVTITSPSKALLTWDSVSNANGYLVVVTDSTTSSLFGTFNTTPPLLNIDTLQPGHLYKADIRAKCANGMPSQKSSRILWLQPQIVVSDEVIMMPGTGNENCLCESAQTWQTKLTPSNSTVNLPTFNFATTNTDRVIYQLKATFISGANDERIIKLAFDEGCGELKIQRMEGERCGNSSITVDIVPTGIHNSIEFSLAGKTIKLSPSYDIVTRTGGLTASFTNCSSNDCELYYRICEGPWVGYCN